MGRDISTLCPPPEGKDEIRAYKAMESIVRKVVTSAAIHHSKLDIMTEVYLAGLWRQRTPPSPTGPKWTPKTA